MPKLISSRRTPRIPLILNRRLGCRRWRSSRMTSAPTGPTRVLLFGVLRVMMMMMILRVPAGIYMLTWHGYLHLTVLTRVLFLSCRLLRTLLRKHFVVPSDGFLVWIGRESLFRNLARERLVIFRVDKRKNPCGFLQVGHVFFRVEQELYRLPYYETTACECGDGGRDEVIVGGWLQRV